MLIYSPLQLRKNTAFRMKKVGDMKTQACLAPSHLAQPTQPPGSLFTRSNAYKNPTLCRTTL